SRFSRTEIELARNVPGVEAVHAMYIEKVLANLRKPNSTSRPIRVLGSDPRSQLFTPDFQPTIDAHREQLLAPRSALIDTTTKKSIYGIAVSGASPAQPMEVELANQRLLLAGTFRLGADFVNDGNILMSLENFALFFPHRSGYGADPLSAVDLGLVKCRPGEDLATVRAGLDELLGDGVKVVSREQYIKDEISVWRDNTPIGAIFKVGMIMGFVVGILICYQVLFNDIADHMAEFATLKAMGYGKAFFVGVVVREAFYLSLLGFVPGTLISWLLFLLTRWLTGLTMEMSLAGIGMTLLLTVAMCVLSGLLAVRKLMTADPASLF
ncbi:MAG: FtsX-like permease family protein, partial [Planctomycetes bacterium]|nr:FtsX-like permease family protein [Planctomycetota bacterium]